MKRNLGLICAVLGVCAASLNAETKPGHQQATVVRVEEYQPASTYIGSPSDAPLQPTEYARNVAIQVGCDVYVGRYESAIDYVPSVFAPNHSVDVSLEKHVMYVSVPGDREVKMGIVSHHHVKDGSCAVGR